MMGEIISQSAATAIIIYSVIAPGSAGALEYPAYKVKVEYAVKSPVYSAYNAQNIGNKVDYYHIFFLLANKYARLPRVVCAYAPKVKFTGRTAVAMSRCSVSPPPQIFPFLNARFNYFTVLHLPPPCDKI